MRISKVLFLLLFSTQIIFAKNITLPDALEKGLVELKAEGEGGHTGKCLKLTIKNLQKKKLDLTIPAGLIFNSADPTTQDLMLVQEKVLELEGNQNRIAKMYAACIQAPNGSPSLGSGFNISSLATGYLLQVAQYIHQEKMYNEPSTQYAVWAISDNKRVENIDHSKLANFVADLLGKAHPEYAVVHRTTSAPGEPAYREAPSILKGRFKFEIQTEKILTFGLYTKEGELVYAFFENKKKTRGLHKFNFTFKVFNMTPGDYLIRLGNNEEVIDEMEVSF